MSVRMALTGDNWVELVKALVWPAVVLFLVVFLARPIRGLLDRVEDWTIKGPGGIEISASKKTETAALLGAAVEKGGKQAPEAGKSGSSPTLATTRISETVDQVFDERGESRIAGRRILWVDDNPANNTYEQQAFKSMGLDIDFAQSTQEALVLLGTRTHDLVISDMKRGTETRAGLTLLDEIQKRNLATPTIIYSLSSALHQEALAKGALGATDRPEQLFELALKALGLWRGGLIHARYARKKGNRR